MDDAAGIVAIGDLAHGAGCCAGAAGKTAPDVLAARLGRDLVGESRIHWLGSITVSMAGISGCAPEVPSVATSRMLRDSLRSRAPQRAGPKPADSFGHLVAALAKAWAWLPDM